MTGGACLVPASVCVCSLSLLLAAHCSLLAESDARYGGFDFRVAHEEAPTDLRKLLDNTESLPFRRRGYERDGMLRTLIERAGFAELMHGAQAEMEAAKAPLAEVPFEAGHIHLDSFFERPVQAELAELLLLPQDDERFTSCILVHGMGGTGKVGALFPSRLLSPYCIQLKAESIHSLSHAFSRVHTSDPFILSYLILSNLILSHLFLFMLLFHTCFE